MVAVPNEFYLRQVNCLTSPERELVEAFRLSVPGNPAAVLFESMYDAFWVFATWGEALRREAFEASFQLVHLEVDGVGIVFTAIPDWFRDYNAAVEAGEAPIMTPCPCIVY